MGLGCVRFYVMKNLLSLDGGGIRGIFSLQVLVEMERQLREREGNPDLVLADHFDYIGGTSTGAIIGSMISWGLPADKVLELYMEQSVAMFRRQRWYRRLSSKFVSEGLKEFFQGFFVEDDGTLSKLGTEKLRTRFLVVTRNARTGSPWPITNNPNAKYNEKGTAGCNLELPLWQLVRASTAAPTFFPPEVVTIFGDGETYGKGVECAFEDGGVTPYNNPAYLLFLKATMPEYRLGWETGVENMNLVSVGTGMVPSGREKSVVSLLTQATTLPESLISSFQKYQDMLCRAAGRCRFGPVVDGEVGDMVREREGDQFGYCRYDYLFTSEEIRQAEAMSKAGFQLDNLEMIPFLLEAGARYASENVRVEDFAPKV